MIVKAIRREKGFLVIVENDARTKSEAFMLFYNKADDLRKGRRVEVVLATSVRGFHKKTEEDSL